MEVSDRVKAIIQNYEGISGPCEARLIKILMHGRLGGTGKLVILPVDQGFEHGPARSFAMNPAAYDPHYHYQLAVDAGLSAFAAPLGMLEAGVETFATKIPTILKINSSNSWATSKDQAITGSVRDAKRLGCCGVGFTIYPGSEDYINLVEEFRAMAAEARVEGLVVVLWSYPRGGNITKVGETALDITAYAAHMAALLGAHIIKVKPPTAHLEQPESKAVYEANNVATEHLHQRIRHIMASTFAGRRLVVFSGGGSKDTDTLLEEIRELKAGGASGSIIGRNSFQRPREEALKLLDTIINIYLER
ncbi:MAG: class I fructose-bisphosphate aldolase [Alphaproteobacteria bacterium]|nr:class I fructose-bisphosphate aldolase [Alphaproteobacteria bacterium]